MMSSGHSLGSCYNHMVPIIMSYTHIIYYTTQTSSTINDIHYLCNTGCLAFMIWAMNDYIVAYRMEQNCGQSNHEPISYSAHKYVECGRWISIWNDDFVVKQWMSETNVPCILTFMNYTYWCVIWVEQNFKCSLIMTQIGEFQYNVPYKIQKCLIFLSTVKRGTNNVSLF